MWTAGIQISDIRKDEVETSFPFIKNGVPFAVISASPDASYAYESKLKRKQVSLYNSPDCSGTHYVDLKLTEILLLLPLKCWD
ncbi:hypothetical protein LEMLEM_LOCUS4883 [Lemmus lemmus]